MDQLIAVALQQLDLVEGNAELLRQHLREGRPMALAVIERAGDNGDRAVGVEADAALFLGHGGGGFDVTGNAKPAQFAFALAHALARLEAGDVGG